MMFPNPFWPEDRNTWPPVPDGMTEVCDNKTVGLLITDEAGRYLMFRRATPPAGIAPPAGHVDNRGGDDETARATMLSEINLKVTSARPVAVNWRRNICDLRHGPMGPGHQWTVFHIPVDATTAAAAQEALDGRWYTATEIQILADRTVERALGRISAEEFSADPGIEPVWIYFLHYLRLIRIDPADLAAVEELTAQSPYGREAGPA